jgi:putative endonuclease
VGDVRRIIGSEAESLAAHWLEARGCRVLERGYRSRIGEVDLILADGPVLVFCEVKARRSGRFGPPEEAVTPLKQSRIRRLAQEYQQKRHLFGCPVRFDVLAVSVARSGPPAIRHIPEAF